MSKSNLSMEEIQSLLDRSYVFDDSAEISETLRLLASADGSGYIETEAAEHIDGLWQHALELAEALEATTSPQWQPIESAPRDGSRFIVCNMLNGSGYMTIGSNYRNCGDEVLRIGDGLYRQYFDFSHWMPLPEVPKEASNGQS